jgi:hypothetical protein
MTVPAPQSSSSSSAAGQAPTIAKDTVTTGTSVTGLAGVFAERDARDVADKIVRAVGSYVEKHDQDPVKIERIRVIGDLSGLTDITTLRLFTGQVTHLDQQITAYLIAAPQPAGKAITAEAVGTAVNLFGLITQMVAGTYTYSGQSIPAGSVGGLDIHIANLAAEHPRLKTLPVHVDRFAAPLPADSHILMQLQALMSRVAVDLNPAIIRAAADAAEKAQRVTDDKDLLAALAAERKTAPEKDAPGDPTKLPGNYQDIFDKLPGKSSAAAMAQNILAEGQALATAISAFVTAAVSAPAAGGLPPAARAAHGEVLSEEGTALLYAQVIAAGDDQILRQDLFRNRWTNLTGLTAEYALMIPSLGNEAVAFDLESAYVVRHGSIRNGLKHVVREKRPQLE